MLWQFGELGYDYSINYCQNGTLSTSCRTDPKPIKWDYWSTTERRKVHHLTASLIALKQKYPAFDDATATLNTTGLLKSIKMDHPSIKMVTIGNFDVVNGQINTNFPSNEWYYNYMGNDSILGSSIERSIPLNAGEYKIYLNQKIDNPYLTLNKNNSLSVYNLSLYPNPSRGIIYLDNLEDLNFTIGQLVITNLNGSKVLERNLQKIDYSEPIDLTFLPSGFYIVTFQCENKSAIGKLIIY